MISKYTILLLFLVYSSVTLAQIKDFGSQLRVIDSLIQYHHTELAQKKTDSIYQALVKSTPSKKQKAQMLELKYRQAVLLNNIENSSSESVQFYLQLVEETEHEDLHDLSCQIYLMIALEHEKSNNYVLCKKYLDLAYEKYKQYGLDEKYSTLCIRLGSYYRHNKKFDSVFYYANEAQKYSIKYNNQTDLADSYLLLGVVASHQENYHEALKQNLSLVEHYKRKNDLPAVSMGYYNVGKMYLKLNENQKALIYADSSFIYLDKLPTLYKIYPFRVKHEAFEALEKPDSALFYFKEYHKHYLAIMAEEEKIKTQQLEEEYQLHKKESIIKSKNQQLVFVSCLLAAIWIAVILVVRKNKKINNQNKIINIQLKELAKTLEQKKLLLSELEHRVKNNLQHVISILEIQKESVNFNNIDELIRGNQNRIHSMALLHKKLNLSKDVNEVEFKKYITELCELVKDSYENHKKTVQLHIDCEIETISIEKALPIGLILVELVSNSMKHAFIKRSIGIINIEFTKNQTNKLYYSDNGTGYDFHKMNEVGLGQEIIKGLIDQLNGSVNTQNNNGFEITIEFE